MIKFDASQRNGFVDLARWVGMAEFGQGFKFASELFGDATTDDDMFLKKSWKLEFSDDDAKKRKH